MNWIWIAALFWWIPAGAETTGTISGKVVNAVTGEPVKGAQVFLKESTITDGAGQFLVPGLAAGVYSVTASSPRYPGLFGNAAASTTVTLKAGDNRSDVVLRLVPAATITGRIVDDGGEPVPNCLVQLRTAEATGFGFGNASSSGNTNDKGEYRLYHVPANRYYVQARCDISLPVNHPLTRVETGQFEPEESWAPVYYPNSPSKSGATVLAALPGSELNGIDFQLHATRVATIQGTVTPPPGLSQQAGIQGRLVSLNDTDTTLNNFGVDGRTGKFSLRFVQPGAYRLDFWAQNPAGPGTSAQGSTEASVGNTPPEPVTVSLGPALVVPGSIELPGVADTAANMHVQLEQIGEMMYLPAAQAQVSNEGTFSLQGVLPGKWRITVQSPNPQLYTESMEWGQQPLTGNETEIGAGDTGPLHIRMNNQVGKLHGNLGAGVVYAVPSGQPLTGQSMSPVAFSQNGSFTADHLRPGDYRVFAFANGVLPASEQVIRLLARRGASVTVTAGSEQSVEVPALSSEDLYQAVLEYLR